MARYKGSHRIELPTPHTERLGVVCTAIGYELFSSENSSSEPKEAHTFFAQSPFSGIQQTTDVWILSYIVRGEGVMMIQGYGEYDIRQGIVTMLRPGTQYQYAMNVLAETCIYYAAFTGQPLNEHAVCTAIDELCSSAEIGLNHEVIEIFQRLFDIGKSTIEDVQREMGATVVLLVAKLINLLHAYRQPHSQPSIAEQAKALMTVHLKDHISIEQIANELKVPNSTFRRVFRRSVGVSPYQYFLQCKVKSAQDELLNSNTPLRIIAEKFGFSDQYHFSRTFQHITGDRPGEWRKNHMEFHDASQNLSKL